MSAIFAGRSAVVVGAQVALHCPHLCAGPGCCAQGLLRCLQHDITWFLFMCIKPFLNVFWHLQHGSTQLEVNMVEAACSM